MTANQTKRRKAFLCYAKKDEERLKTFVDAIRDQLDAFDLFVDRNVVTGEMWNKRIRRELRNANVAIVLASPSLLASKYARMIELPYIRARGRAGSLAVFWIRLRRLDSSETFPTGRDRAAHAAGTRDWLEGIQTAHDFGLAFDEAAGEAQKKVFLDQVIERVRRDLNRPRNFRELAAPPKESSHDRINIDALADTDGECIGRERELEQLHEAWRQKYVPRAALSGGAFQTNIVTLVAPGGLGKSTLVDRFLFRLKDSDALGPDTRVFGWSFYGQSSSQERAFSAPQFLESALRWFGDDKPTTGSPWDQAIRLAALVGSQRAILVLDGLEPQQWSIQEWGAIKDPALAILIETLAHRNDGLCIVTSRQRVEELHRRKIELGLRYMEIDLRPLAAEEGVELLQARMVVGEEEALKKVALSVGNHALELSLLSEFLVETLPDPDLPHVKLHEKALRRIANARGSKTDAVLKLVESRFSRDLPELELMRILSLFDRPMLKADIWDIASSNIEGVKVNGPITGFSRPDETNADFTLALGRLKQARLVSLSPTSRVVDVHPLVRQYFSRDRDDRTRRARTILHGRVANMFHTRANLSPKKIEDAENLYFAGYHLGRSGAVGKASAYYWTHIRKGEDQFSQQTLAAYGHDLTVLKGLFRRGWSELDKRVPRHLRAPILRDAAICLQALCQLDFAKTAMRASLKAAKRTEDLAEASYSASYLSELLVIRGELRSAVWYGQHSIALGKRALLGKKRNRAKNLQAHVSSFSSAADALHQAGDMKKARKLFDQGLIHQKEKQKIDGWRSNFTLQGYHYACFLITEGAPRDAVAWLRQQLQRGPREKSISEGISILTHALDQVALGQAYLAIGDQTLVDEAEKEIESGVKRAHESRDATFWPAALLALAALRRIQGKYAAAEADLEMVTTFAGRGTGMPLYEFDADLERLRIHVSQPKPHHDDASARATLQKAQRAINDLGYERRRSTLNQLAKELHELERTRPE